MDITKICDSIEVPVRSSKRVKDSYLEGESKYAEILSGKVDPDKLKSVVKEYFSKYPYRTLYYPEGSRKEILAFADDQSGKPMFSYKQKAWEYVEDSAVTTSSDVSADIPGKTKPVDDSRQDETVSYSWEEFEQKLNDYKELTNHAVIINGKTYILSGTVSEESEQEPVSDSDYRIEDDREYTKEQLISRPPLWIKDVDIWNKAVTKATHDGTKATTVIVPIVLYKKMGGTKAMSKKEKAEREAADTRRIQAEVAREGVEDSFFRRIQEGDNLQIIRGNHPGVVAEVLSINEDGSYKLKNLTTGEEFEEPNTLYGVFVTVTDSISVTGVSKLSEVVDSEDIPSVRRALATILETSDSNLRVKGLRSRILSLLNASGLQAEIDERGNVWVGDNVRVWVEDDSVTIYKDGEKVSSYSLLDEINDWFNKIKELV